MAVLGQSTAGEYVSQGGQHAAPFLRAILTIRKGGNIMFIKQIQLSQTNKVGIYKVSNGFIFLNYFRRDSSYPWILVDRPEKLF